VKSRTNIIVIIMLVLVAFLVGRYFKSGSNGPQGERKVLYYVDPMHPSYKSDKPGIAPDCGMKLEPVYADGAGVSAPTETAAAPGTVRISTDRQQLIGVKVATVEKRPVNQTIRMLGRVAVDETRVYRVNATVDGWITRTSQKATGGLVKKDEALAGFYSSELQPVQTTYIYTLNSNDRVVKQDASLPGREAQILQFDNSLKQQRENLMNLGMSAPQLEEINRTREYQQTIDIVSPADGIILVRNVTLNLRFERGTELYRIADLSHVWILADVFENEAQFLRSGAVAKVTLPNQNRTLIARVSDAIPQFDTASRTLKLRLEADNPDLQMLPDMFVDIELPVHFEPTITVPVDAVVDTGLRKVVFLDRGDGTFEPRRVETGWRRGGLVEITRGLMNGERIVVSGTFMIDSESRMQAAAMGIYDEGVMDPVCGMYIDEKKARAAGRTMKFSGATYFFCSPECQHDFEKAPKKYQAAPGAQSAAAAPATASPAMRSMAVATPVMTNMPNRDHPVMPAPGMTSPAATAPAMNMPTMSSPTGTHQHPN
jgi:membrane fusion protein, copper/silver efflux system